jgi:Flp pilus assembly protein TadD
MVAYYKPGTALAMTGRLEEATAKFEQALRLDPGFYLARLNPGHTLMLEGRTEDAQDHTP